MAGTKATLFTCAPGARQAGFSLIELFVAVAIAAVVLAMALPNFREATVRNTTTALGNELVGDMNFARAEAVKRGGQVRVVANASGWTAGWTIEYQDLSTNTYVTGSPLRKHAATPSGYTVKGQTGIGTAATAVEFNSTGALIQTLATAGGYVLQVCRPDNKLPESRRVDVGPTGIVSVRRSGTTNATTCP